MKIDKLQKIITSNDNTVGNGRAQVQQCKLLPMFDISIGL